MVNFGHMQAVFGPADDTMRRDEKGLHVVIESNDPRMIDVAKGTAPYRMVVIGKNPGESTTNEIDFESRQLVVPGTMEATNYTGAGGSQMLAFGMNNVGSTTNNTERKASAPSNCFEANKSSNEWVILDPCNDTNINTDITFDDNVDDFALIADETSKADVVFTQQAEPIQHQSDYEKLAIELAASKRENQTLLRYTTILLRQAKYLASERDKAEAQRKLSSKKRKHRLPFVPGGTGERLYTSMARQQQTEPLKRSSEHCSMAMQARSMAMQASSRGSNRSDSKVREYSTEDPAMNSILSSLKWKEKVVKWNHNNRAPECVEKDAPMDQMEALSLDW